MNDMEISIGSKIRKERERQGMSQRRLGMVLGLSDKAVSSYESDRTVPSLDTLMKIANELGKPINYFLSDYVDDIDLVDHMDLLQKKVDALVAELAELKEAILRKNSTANDNG